MATITKQIIAYGDKEVEVEVKEITLREVYDALEKNGWEHLRGTWFGDDPIYEDGAFAPKAGCVLAQTAINLGAPATSSPLDWFSQKEFGRSLYGINPTLNSYNLHFQLSGIEVGALNRWAVPDIDNVGSTIIYWNDHKDLHGSYTLKTYKDVAKMAYDVLEPHFDETIKVLVASRESGIPITDPNYRMD